MLIIFDLDNTLVDRNSAYTEWFRGWYLATHKQSLSKKLESQVMMIDNNAEGEPIATCEAILKCIGDVKTTPECLWKMTAGLLEFMQPSERIIQSLDKLSNRYRLALLTNGSVSRQSRKLERSMLSRYFELIQISQKIGFKKPSQSAFESIYRKLEIAPTDCLMIGDSEQNDIVPAKALGMKTVKVTGFLTDRNSETIADRSIEHISELKGWLYD